MKAIAISDTDYLALRQALFTSDGKENAAFLVCGVSETKDNFTYLIREVLPVPDDGYVERLSYHLEIAPRFINSVVDRCVGKGFGIVATHSHPGHGIASYSTSDDHGESRLFAVFADLLGPRKHASLLFTQDDIAGRLFADRRREQLDRLTVVGEHLDHIALRKRVTSRGARPSNTLSRQLLAFGEEGQGRLRELRIGIVGVGGTGSAVVEQLARLGVERFVLVDPDHFEVSNLSRLYGSRIDDTKHESLAKTKIASRLIKSINPGAEVKQVQDSVVRQPVLMQLRECDVIFACTDNDWSRSVLNRLAYQYLIPLIDLGIRITVSGAAVTGIGGRVARVGPGTACLRCARHLDPERIRAESMPAEQRSSLAKEQYIKGVENPAPAVVSYNSTVAGLAVSELLSLVLRIGSSDRANELMYDGMEGIVFRVRPEADPRCDVCSPMGLKAIGDLQVVSAYD